MFCKKCGKKLPENAKVCSQCGTPLTQRAHENGKQQELGRIVFQSTNGNEKVKTETEGTIRIPIEPVDRGDAGQDGTIRYVSPRQGGAGTGKTPSQRRSNPNKGTAKQPVSARDQVKEMKREQKKKKSKALIVLLSILVVVVILAAVVIGVFLFQNGTLGEGAAESNTSVTTEEPKEEKKEEKKEEQAVTIPSQLELNGHSYALFNVTEKVAKTWDEAKKYCESLGGYLAIINSEEENQALYQLVCDKAGGYAFFGYSDELSEGTWLWSDGSEDSGYTNWGVDSDGNPEPNSASTKEDYAEFTANRPDGSWNDSTFGQDTYVFICEWDSVSN